MGRRNRLVGSGGKGKIIDRDDIEDAHVTDVFVLDVRAGSFGGFLGDSCGKATLFTFDGVGHDALGRELRFADSGKQLVVSVLDLPFLSELVGIFHDGDSVAGDFGALAVTQDSTHVMLFGKVEAGADHILEHLDSKVMAVLEVDDKLGLLFADDLTGYRKSVHGGFVHVGVGDSVEQVVAPSGDLEDVLANLDGNGLNERIGVTDRGADVDGESDLVVVVRDIDQNQVTSTVEVCQKEGWGERHKLVRRIAEEES